MLLTKWLFSFVVNRSDVGEDKVLHCFGWSLVSDMLIDYLRCFVVFVL